MSGKGAAPLDPAVKKVAALAWGNGLPALLGDLHAMGVGAFFSFGAEADFKDASMVRAIADQGGLGLPDRDYYFRDDPKSVELRASYLVHVGRMLALANGAASRNDTGAAGANTVMKIETALARAALDAVHRRDPAALYHMTTLAEIQQLTPSFNWTAYFTGVGAPPIDAINVTEPDFFKA